MDNERCETCRFWRKLEPQHTYADCLRFPPQLELSVNVRRDGYDAGRDTITVTRFPYARWPNTAEQDFCGEYQPIDRKAVVPALKLDIPGAAKVAGALTLATLFAGGIMWTGAVVCWGVVA